MFDKQKLILDSKDLICRSGLENTLHIAFAADENYAKHIGVVIFSVLQNNPHLDLHFHLFVDELPASEEKRILALEPLHSRFSVSVYYLDSSVFGSLQICEHFSKAMYYRMAIPNVLQGAVEKVLYLDTDILCQGDLKELSAYDLTGYAAAMVRDLCQLDGEHRKLFIDNGLDAKDYFNSGVMLIHIPNWFSLSIPEKIHHFISDTHNIDLKYPDQDILNLALSSKVKELPSRYNWLYWLGKFNFHKNNPDIAIVHYIGCDKPWTTYCFDDCYNAYYQKSPWADVPFLGIPKNKTASQIRVISKRLWIRGEKRFACKAYWGYLLMKVKLFKHYPF